jgi:hypothetical protein
MEDGRCGDKTAFLIDGLRSIIDAQIPSDHIESKSIEDESKSSIIASSVRDSDY